jgi:hypothetical protein
VSEPNTTATALHETLDLLADVLKPGDKVEIVIYPLKSGEPGGTFLRATLPDGTVKVMFGRGP